MVAMKSMSVVVLSGALLLGACTNPDGTRDNTNSGVGIGAAIGGIFGALVADDDLAGAAIGGAVGAMIGGAIGADLDKQEAALRSTMDSSVKIVNTGSQLIVSLPEGITFPTNSAVVKSSLVGDLNKLSRSMNEYPNTRIEVVGHTDNTGTSSYNQALSEQRARAVRGILINGGVSSSRVSAFGAGESRPVASNGSASGRQANRRVEIYITPNQ